MNNIESFDICAAYIFSELYQSFPIRKDITLNPTPDDIFQDIDDDSYAAEKAFIRVTVFKETAQWLIEAGYIWVDGKVTNQLHSAVLSPKGLEALKSMPKSLSPDKTLGEQMTELLKTGTRGLLSKAVDQALSTGLALAIGA